MKMKLVNTIYLVVNNKEEIYSTYNSFDDAENDKNSYNGMTQTYKDEIPFKIIEVECDSYIEIIKK